ncbi:MAG TPA: ATP-binding protein [Thermoanaerobaculia bacterium]|nr:ATP-binding protein [Thermoanaerobaculia bacterium]
MNGTNAAAAYAGDENVATMPKCECVFRMMFDWNLAAMFVWRADVGITDANDRFLDVAGYTRADLESGSIPWTELVPGPWRSRAERTPAAGESSKRYEKEYARSSGRRIYIAVEAAWNAASGEGVALVTEITERRLAEEALASARAMLEERTAELAGTQHELRGAASALSQTERNLEHASLDIERMAARLTAMNRELESFSYSVSHDLRTPLRSIAGFSKALAARAEGLDDRSRDYLVRIVNATTRMSQLIDDLLKLARISRRAPVRQRVDLGALARDTMAELRKTAPDRRVEVLIEEDLIAEGDESLLRVLLQNLLGNAWKFTSRRAEATIRFGRSSGNGRTTFYVRDDGAGFDMKYADQMFVPFQRLHTIEEFEGTGIGLATAQRIISAHGGEIRAEGVVDGGATFFFTISDRRTPISTQSRHEGAGTP